MRLPFLLLAMLFTFSLLSYGRDPAPIIEEAQKANLPNQVADETSAKDTSSWRVPLRRTLDGEADEPVCYTLRSYIMQREAPGSDVTRRVKYRTCQPSWKFEFRSADAARDR